MLGNRKGYFRRLLRKGTYHQHSPLKGVLRRGDPDSGAPQKKINARAKFFLVGRGKGLGPTGKMKGLRIPGGSNVGWPASPLVGKKI